MTDLAQKTSLLSPAICKAIDEWVKRYPPERKASGVLQALHYVQAAHNDSLTTELLDAVADYLEMPRTVVYEVASFYTLYNLKPVGRHIISVCTNISCMLRGSEDIVAHLKKRLQVETGETTADGQFTLRAVECLGACIGAPMLQMGKDYHENLTPEKVDHLLDQVKN